MVIATPQTLSSLNGTMPHILVVDDDARLRSLLRRFLAEHGFVVTTAASAALARSLLADLAFDLMILDIMMPGESGLELAWSLRNSNLPARDMPILLLTARAEADDRIRGLEAGADDYVVKPFEPRELLLRVQSIMRRTTKPLTKTAMAEIRLGSWRFDPSRDALMNAENHLPLTSMEAGLLRILAAEPGVAISREHLAERVAAGSANHTINSIVNDRTIDVQITRLRRKIEPDAKAPRYLITVRGVGYMLVPDGTP